MVAHQRINQLVAEAKVGSLLVVPDMGIDSRTVHLALTHRVHNGQIEYIAPNIFRKPLHSKLLDVDIPVSPDEVIPVIARLNQWTVIPAEVCCLNRLGLSTQVPAYYLFSSTGPDTVMQIGGHLVSFLHCGARYMTELRGRARLLVHAMSGEKQYDCSIYWERARGVLSEEEKLQLRQHMDCVPAWMQPHIQELINEADRHEI